MVKHLEKNETIEEIVGKDKYIVDFYADWCGPCKMLAPILEEIDANVLKINVDDNPEIAQRFGVMSIPTLLFYKNGEVVRKEIGLRSKSEIEEIVKAL